MKKILLLGGSAQQIIAIETAKKLGYYTILCDYLNDNPGQYIADKFYLVSTTDKEKILEVAIQEKIDGILAYASDPAAPTAAYVAEKLYLSGNPYKSVEILCNKDKFRDFLHNNGFNAPFSKGFNSYEKVKSFISNYNFPIIIKPVDSSGSKGVTTLYNLEGLEVATKNALSYSRSQTIIIEEFIEKKHKYLIGGDIFVIDGDIKIWGLMNCHRDNNVNPLVPVGKSFPLELDKDDIENVKETLKNIVSNLNIKNGAMNVELIVDKNGKVFPIDIGPRSGGNMIPDLLNYIFNIDMVELSINAAMGKKLSIIDSIEGNMFYATHNLHSSKNGYLKRICISNELEKFIIKKKIYVKENDYIEYFSNSSKALGILFFKFNNYHEMNKYLENINNYINIEIKEKE